MFFILRFLSISMNNKYAESDGAQKYNIFKSADISLLGVANALFIVGISHESHRLMNRKHIAKAIFRHEKRSSNELSWSAHFFGTGQEQSERRTRLAFRRVLIGFRSSIMRCA